MRGYAWYAGLLASVLLAGRADEALIPSAAAAGAAPIAKAGVRALHARCVEAMVRSACVASKDHSAAAASTPASPVVMLAGVGAVDARFYAQLRSAGDGMCEILVQPCEQAWEGSACRTARALWAEQP